MGDDNSEVPFELPYAAWLFELEEDVIQGEFEFEPGDFIIYLGHWRELFDAGLTPREAWLRAVDGYVNGGPGSDLAPILSDVVIALARSKLQDHELGISGYDESGAPY